MNYDEYSINHMLMNKKIESVEAALKSNDLSVTHTDAGDYAYTSVTLADRKLFSFSNFGKPGDDPLTVSRLFFYDKNASHIGFMVLNAAGYTPPKKTRFWFKAMIKWEIILAVLALPFAAVYQSIAAAFY